MEIWRRNSHLEEVPELSQSEITEIVQVRRLEEPELKDVIWSCWNHWKAIILCDYVISYLFCKYVNIIIICVYIYIMIIIISYQNLTMDFMVDMWSGTPYLTLLCVVEWIAAWWKVLVILTAKRQKGSKTDIMDFLVMDSSVLMHPIALQIKLFEEGYQNTKDLMRIRISKLSGLNHHAESHISIIIQF